MFDTYSLTKQDESSHKLNLLKQIKLSIESLMFDSGTANYRSSWQNLGIINILARNILTILEDGIILTESMSSSPNSGGVTNNLMQKSSRSATLLSLGMFDEYSTGQKEMISQAVWSFVISVFNSDKLEYDQLEKSARKDFEIVFSQIKQESASDTAEINCTFSWITISLRQSIFLNQLAYLVRDIPILEKFYKPNAFLMDRSFVNDLLNYIKACETRDCSVLKKIRRNFFSQTLSNNSPPTTIIDKNSRSSTIVTMPSSHASSFNLQTNHLTVSNSPSSSNSTSANNSIIEAAINEVNLSNKLKQQQTHRRMHSFPNIQINEAKRNKMYSDANQLNASFEHSATKQASQAKDSLVGSVAQINKIEESNLESNHLSTSTQLLNNQIEENLLSSETTQNADFNDIYSKTSVFDFIHSQQINCDCNQVDKENSHFIIADITIAAFELIKTQELDDLNDLKLIEELTSVQPPSPELLNPNFLTVNRSKNLNTSKKPQVKSSGIQINTSNSYLRNPREAASPLLSSSFASNFSPIVNGSHMFPSDDYASSVEKEVFFTSGCVSPNLDCLSASSAIIGSKENTDLPKRGHKKSLSYIHPSISNQDLIRNETIISKDERLFKSLSSNNLIRQSSAIHVHTLDTIDSTGDNQKKKHDKIVFNFVDASFTNQSNANISLSPQAENTSRLTLNNNNNNSKKNFSMDLSNNTVNSEVSNRTRRFSWEEIINLDTAEHIANRLIERLIESENQRRKQLTRVPCLKQFEIFIQLLEYFEYMQVYYEMRSSGALHRYIQALAFNNSKSFDSNMSASTISNISFSDRQPKPSASKNAHLINSIAKSFEKSMKSKTSMISKIKIAAVAAAAAVSISQFNLEQRSKAKDEDDTNNLIKRISLNIQDSINPETGSINTNSSLNLIEESNEVADIELLNKSIQSSKLNSDYKTLTQARILGDELWAPVRDQLILNITPKQKRLNQMTAQNFRCADCGIQVHKDKMKSFNYCEYYCKYFCRCCHINDQSYIPAYIVNALDFKTKYEVSKKAKNFLQKIYNEPVITLESLNPSLFERANIFSKMKKIRCRLYNCRQYINSCRFSIDLKKHLYSQFDDFIINDQMVYSIETLFKIKQTNYYEVLKKLVNDCIDHIKNCELCSQQGYICGLCTNNELLYPFDLDKVQKCENCLACCHKTCLKKPELCPRCKRKQNRLRINSISSGTTSIALNE